MQLAIGGTNDQGEKHTIWQQWYCWKNTGKRTSMQTKLEEVVKIYRYIYMKEFQLQQLFHRDF